MSDTAPDLQQRLVWAPIAVFLFVARRIPFRQRVNLGGWLISWVVRLLPGQRKRVMANLSLVWPDMSEAEKRALLPRIGRTIGRSTTEVMFCDDHARYHLPFRVSGPGLDLIRQAEADKRPVVLVTGHFGQWEAPRLHLMQQGLPTGALYRPHNNLHFNAYFVRGLASTGEPMLPRGKQGYRGMMRHLKSGGRFVILPDQHHYKGTPIPFLGVEALTPLSAAEVALRQNALMIPFFGIRRDDEGCFDVIYEAPIKNTDPVDMMRQFNDMLSDYVRAYPDQWLWVHRRWKK